LNRTRYARRLTCTLCRGSGIWLFVDCLRSELRNSDRALPGSGNCRACVSGLPRRVTGLRPAFTDAFRRGTGPSSKWCRVASSGAIGRSRVTLQGRAMWPRDAIAEPLRTIAENPWVSERTGSHRGARAMRPGITRRCSGLATLAAKLHSLDHGSNGGAFKLAFQTCRQRLRHGSSYRPRPRRGSSRPLPWLTPMVAFAHPGLLGSHVRIRPHGRQR
jgi:hypothetical protein